MNPYDFVRIDWERPPERHRPVWHHRLVGQGGQRLYSGHIEVDVTTETPLFIASPLDFKKPAQSIQNKRSEYIIPGSSLKGMLRCLVETLGNGCLTLFDGKYERNQVNYERDTPRAFQKCDDNTVLCIACRTFGMLKDRSVYLGKVNIGDASVLANQVSRYPPIHLAALMEPKPHHRDFYMDVSKRRIAGRKYYFHHSPDEEPVTDNKSKYARHIQPLTRGTKFHFRLDFTNLEEDEFAALLLAITLEPEQGQGMRHKIGSGKPLGLGSVHLEPTSMTLVDYSTRYTQPGPQRGKTVLTNDAFWDMRDDLVDSFSQSQLVSVALDDLRRIWSWPPDPNVEYYYPSKGGWFDTPDSIGKRIADTTNTP